MPEDEKPTSFVLEPLARHHKRARFSCGIDALDRYLKTQASQDARRRVAAAFVAATADNVVIGYYTLSALSIDLAALPAAQAKKLPRYPAIPATLLGRLAVDSRHRGTGLGELLLVDALARSYRATSDIASFAVVVDAKNEAAVAFYKRYGFAAFPDRSGRLFLPMSVIGKVF